MDWKSDREKFEGDRQYRGAGRGAGIGERVELDSGNGSSARESESRRASLFLEKPLSENQLLNYSQASKYLGVSVSKLKKMKAAGTIPHVLIGDLVRFRISSIDRWIQRKEVT